MVFAYLIGKLAQLTTSSREKRHVLRTLRYACAMVGELHCRASKRVEIAGIPDVPTGRMRFRGHIAEKAAPARRAWPRA